MASNFPSQTIPQIDKDQKTEKGINWGKRCVDYGISLLDYQDRERNTVSRLYQSYNGIRLPESIKWITQTYGTEARAKFVSYKVGRSKQYLLYRDWETDRKSTRLNSSHRSLSRMPSSA